MGNGGMIIVSSMRGSSRLRMRSQLSLSVSLACLSFDIDNYMNLLLLKRTDFRHEQETRFFIVKHQDLLDMAEKATESIVEYSDATGRKVLVQRGALLVLNDIPWLDILKSITINAEVGSLPYLELKNTIDSLIDDNESDPARNAEYKSRLTPIPYLVYGTRPPVITIDK